MLVIAGIFISLGSCRQQPAAIGLADYVLENKLTSGKDSEEIRGVIDTLVETTIWKERVRINKEFKKDFINLYILDGSDVRSRLNDKVSELLSNCFYAGSNIIFLDIAYLRGFLKKHGVDSINSNGFFKEKSESFLFWAIGHEIGHLMCGHLQSHFDTSSLERFVSTSTISNKEELQADSTFVSLLTGKGEIKISVERVLLDILNVEIRQKLGNIKTMGVGLFYDYTNEHIVSYARQPTHPEYVVRLARMLELSTRGSEAFGMHYVIAGFIKQMKEVK